MINKRIVYVFFALVLIINIVGIIILPEDIVMQVNTSGEANWSANKYVAIAFMFGFGVLGGLNALLNNRSLSSKYFLMGVIIVVYILIFVFNL